MLPFTSEQFLAVFVNYNRAIWPIQIAAYVLGALSIASLFRRTRAADASSPGFWPRCGCGPALPIMRFHSLRSITQPTFLLCCSSSRAAMLFMQACIAIKFVLAYDPF